MKFFLQSHFSKFIGSKNYNYWSIQMKVLFQSQDLSDLVFIGYMEVTNDAVYNAIPSKERKVMLENRIKDLKTL